METLLHINLLELQAICLALKPFLLSIKGSLVQVLMDNTTAMWYCNKQQPAASRAVWGDGFCAKRLLVSGVDWDGRALPWLRTTWQDL